MKVKKIWRGFIHWIMRVWISLKKKLVKRERRVYRVIASSEISMIGGTFISRPKVGKQIVVIAKKQGYLTLDPVSIAKFNKGNRFIVYGKVARITAKRIR